MKRTVQQGGKGGGIQSWWESWEASCVGSVYSGEGARESYNGDADGLAISSLVFL